MRFEFSIALKYLLPRIKQISVSIIALLSILVISLVVWLVLVFMSVTDGLEKGWIDKLVSLNGPLRITPTDAYYQSYYYQIDALSQASDYSQKTIREKKESLQTNPYDEEIDLELPVTMLSADLSADGHLKDLVKEAYAAIDELASSIRLSSFDYETALSQLQLKVVRDAASTFSAIGESENFLNNLSYLVSFEGSNSHFSKTLLPPTPADYNNLLKILLRQYSENESMQHTEEIQTQLQSFFQNAQITHLKTAPQGWRIPAALLPKAGKLVAYAVEFDGRAITYILPEDMSSAPKLQQSYLERGYKVVKGTIQLGPDEHLFQSQNKNEPIRKLAKESSLLLDGELLLPASFHGDSAFVAKSYSELVFEINFALQKLPISGKVPLSGLEIGKVAATQNASSSNPPLWVYQTVQNGEKLSKLPQDPLLGHGALLAKSYRDNGVRLGDRGNLSYYASTASSFQEQHAPIFVAGFYDPGIIPIGGKLLFVSPELTNSIRAALGHVDQGVSNGIQIWFDQIEEARNVKSALQKAFADRGIAPYWKIETYHDYEFSKDLIQQLGSDKNLFTLLAVIIIIVACSNIISMLILLVNDKKKEIGILQSMGTSAGSVALIFGSCGVILGLLSSLLGTFAAFLTLQNLQSLVDLLSAMQGHNAFNAAFYGDSLPNQMSAGALKMVWMATSFISLLAGLVPAIKASRLKPAAILRAE